MSARIVFEHVSRRFGDVVALHDLDLTLEPGTTTAVVGPSGAGKSTLLSIAAGLDTQVTGRVRREPGTVRTAFAFQEPRLLPWLSVERNVALAPRLQGHKRREALRLAREALDAVGLGDRTDAMAWALSGGMRQRVSLARALAVEPDLLLLDEPLSALDEGSAEAVRDVVARACPPGRRTVVYVTHAIGDACLLADRVLVLAGGRLVEDLPVERPRPRVPADPWVRSLQAEISALVRGLASAGGAAP